MAEPTASSASAPLQGASSVLAAMDAPPKAGAGGYAALAIPVAAVVLLVFLARRAPKRTKPKADTWSDMVLGKGKRPAR